MNRFFKHIGVIAGVFLLISCGDDKAAQQQGQAQAQQAQAHILQKSGHKKIKHKRKR